MQITFVSGVDIIPKLQKLETVPKRCKGVLQICDKLETHTHFPWVFFCKVDVYFQNTFCHWETASEK